MGKAARRSVASDPSSPTLPYHYQQEQQQQQGQHHQRQVHQQQEHLYYSSSLSYPSSYTPSSPSSPSSSFTDSGFTGSGYPIPSLAFSSTPAGPQLQAPRTATLQSAPPGYSSSSLAPGGAAEPGSGASELFIHSSTAATPNSNITPEFSSTAKASSVPRTVTYAAPAEPTKTGPPVTSVSTPPATTTTNTTQATLLPSFRLSSNQTQVDRERERLRMEFYATYDVMTGVRIAATLGGFFGLMVFLVIYKSRTRSTAKALKDPTIAAVAAAVIQEEEERELQEAIEATAFSLLQEELNINYPGLQRDRLLSLGNISAPPMLSRGRRMSSISGGYSSLLNPSRRFSYSSTRGHRNSVSVSSRVLSAYNMGGSFGQDDYVLESDGEEADDEFDQFTTTAEIGYPSNYLSVPNKCNESRRSSAMTCCSTESSFLERRCSAITLGLSSLPPISRSPSRQQSRDDTTDWEPFYPGINIIEATPKSSPCPSERIAHRGHHHHGADSDRPSTSRGRSASQFLTPQPSTSSGGTRVIAPAYDDGSIDCISEYPVGSGLEDGFGYRPTRQRAQPSTSGTRPYSNGRPADDVSLANVGILLQRSVAEPRSVTAHATNNSSNSANVNHSTTAVRRAPLASLSSFKMSSIDCQDTDPKSGGSDSVFGEDSGADTDEDLQQFSTDSDELSLTMPYEEDEESHGGQQRVQRTGGRGSLYRRQSTLAQGDELEEEEEDGGTLLPCGNDRSVYELEHELDVRQQQLLHHQPTTDTSYLSSLSISNRSGSKGRASERGVQPAPTSGPGVGKRIETKAIIERQQPNDSSGRGGSYTAGGSNLQQQQQQRQSPLGAIPKGTRTTTTTASGPPPTVMVHLPDDDRPSGSSRRSAESDSSSRPSSSGESARQHQQCVEVNVIIKNSSSSSNTTIKSPSVILELPILAIDEDDDPSSSAPALSANDPCIPGPSRKWSKETLF
ncbi:uncharacterized protein LOC133393245 isoform X1 [Anopheles gambiae]|uniref:uncharacterized protein LOC133393245 isoform X1 n=1 Tax=Anopheles gambiae TaxID=7165 RepID=UPI002AC9A6A6|nr:uncharacterized protein LOC133393245 isoform X1 [Anopheles gambiae]XP_061513157.1 uncharacterized protein LOC133393245 isoform X1 [Anopheles gambiae]XP_061513158.1 uncharacterized protein LOC133393245 isoform X1 [Anopheles gambiae]